MRITIVEGLFIVKSGLTIEDLKQALLYAPDALVVRDEDNNAVYAVSQVTSGTCAIKKQSFTANALTESEELMYTEPVFTQAGMSREEALEQFKMKHGQALVAAQKYLPIIKQQIAEAVEPINDLMASISIDTTEEEAGTPVVDTETSEA